jgi:hypothetical protein
MLKNSFFSILRCGTGMCRHFSNTQVLAAPARASRWAIQCRTKQELIRAEAEHHGLLVATGTNARKPAQVVSLLPRAVNRYRALVQDLERVTQRNVACARTQVGALLRGPCGSSPPRAGAAKRPRLPEITPAC